MLLHSLFFPDFSATMNTRPAPLLSSPLLSCKTAHEQRNVLAPSARAGGMGRGGRDAAAGMRQKEGSSAKSLQKHHFGF
jgi:hypothetical protein